MVNLAESEGATRNGRRKKHGYGEKYHISRHRKYITKDTYFHFCSKVAEEKFWSFLEGKTIEVGCGIGQNIYGHKETVGTDISEFALGVCRRRGLRCLSLMDAENMSFIDSTFDSVLCSHVLEHMEAPLSALKEFARILKEDGKLVLAIPVDYKKSTQIDQHLYKWGLIEITNLLHRAGFEVVRAYSSCYALKKILCYLPCSFALTLSKFAGLFRLFFRLRSGPSELIIYAKKRKNAELDEVSEIYENEVDI